MTAVQTRPAEARGEARPAGRPTPDEAAWIRDHAWTAAMRHRHAIFPDSACLCQSGRSHMCANGEHDRCDLGALTNFHTLIRLPDDTPARFPHPYRHPTESDLGPVYERSALVWLADRVCRWQCPCGCHTAPPEPVQPVQLDLFGAAL